MLNHLIYALVVFIVLMAVPNLSLNFLERKVNMPDAAEITEGVEENIKNDTGIFEEYEKLSVVIRIQMKLWLLILKSI